MVILECDRDTLEEESETEVGGERLLPAVHADHPFNDPPKRSVYLDLIVNAKTINKMMILLGFLKQNVNEDLKEIRIQKELLDRLVE